jgi:hypothetical protein
MALLSAGALFYGARSLAEVGIVLLYAGFAAAVLGILFIRPGRTRGSGSALSPHMLNDTQFKEWRARERPDEFAAWAVVAAAVLVAITGYLISYVAPPAATIR